MTDAETRAEWNRLLAADESDLTVDDLLKLPPGAISLLRLLAESQQALREIREINDNDDLSFRQAFDMIDKILKTACKEE